MRSVYNLATVVRSGYKLAESVRSVYNNYLSANGRSTISVQ